MADYSLGYGGIGSGLDITGMVTQLVAAERAPADARLNRIASGANFKLSALGKVSAGFASLESALKALKAADAFDRRTATVGTDTVLAASVGTGTATGAYQVEVQQLASAHKWIANQAVAEGQTFGAGNLTLQLGGEQLNVEIAAGSTLADLRDALDAAGRAHGLQASVITTGAGQYLSLSSNRTGAANTVTLALDQGGSDLQSLVASLEQRSAAADAVVSIDGLAVTAAGNRISDVVPGLTLDLKSIGVSQATVASDPAAGRQRLQDFVAAYNAVLGTIASVTRYDASSNTPSALTGDAQMRGAAGQLRAMLGDLLASLAQQGLDAATLGLQTQGYPSSDGTLVLDTTKLDAVLAASPERIRSAFTGAGGFADRLLDTLGGYLGTDGALAARTEGLNRQIRDVEKQRTALDARMEAVGNRYKTQFVALDSLIAQMSTTSDYLAQQLAALKAQTRA